MSEQIQQFNPAYLTDMSAGDEEFIREILATFFETSQDLLEGIRTAALDGSIDRAIYVSHTLKGSARSIGAMPVGALCEDLERLARVNDMAGFSTLADSLPRVFAELETEVSYYFQSKAA